MDYPLLYRKRIIPEECVLLKDDKILLWDDHHIVTSWNALKPRKDLHHGFSCYFLKENYKISKFYGHQGELLYIYCDIISPLYNEETKEMIITDLLADLICYPNGDYRIADLEELAICHQKGKISNEQLDCAILALNSLLSMIYDGSFEQKLHFLEQYEYIHK